MGESANLGNQGPDKKAATASRLIVWAPTRERAIVRMKRALNDTIITGIPTTIDNYKLILDIQVFNDAKVNTVFIPKHEDDLQVSATFPESSSPTRGSKSGCIHHTSHLV